MSAQPRDPSPADAGAAITRHFYDELHALARRRMAGEREGHTLQPTALVHEACLRLLTTSPLPAVSRAEQLALASRVLHQVLVDHERRRSAAKRGGGRLQVQVDADALPAGTATVDFEALHEALERLRELHARQAEVVALRVFGGLTMEQVAAVLHVSKRTAEEDWAVARAWLRRELTGDRGEGP